MALSLQIASTVVAPPRNPYRFDEELLDYQRDLLAPFGVPFQEELLRAGPNVGFSELTDRAMDAVWPIPRPDMVIVSYGLPDWYPFKTISAYVDHLLGGGACNFAVSEQGLCAPFTALRIAGAFARSGRCRSLALLVLEQTTFGHHDPLVHDTPLVDSGVFLFFGADGTLDFRPPQGCGPEGDVGALVTEVAAAAAGAGEVLVVAGPWTDAGSIAATGLPCHRVEPGSYCTSVWLALARHHERWAAEYDAVVLCDTDPRTGDSRAILLPGKGSE